MSKLTQEADAMKRGKDRQISEVKNLAQSNLESLQKDYESKISDLKTQFDEDRTRLEQAHAESIQELIDDTNRRLHKMERCENETILNYCILQDIMLFLVSTASNSPQLPNWWKNWSQESPLSPVTLKIREKRNLT